jgi:YegS/Rv2252/BmrU family lipid kinase
VVAIGVLVHEEKSLGGGLEALRAALADAGHADPPWRGVTRSKDAPRQVRKLVEHGVDRLLVWGGDGMVRRTIDTLVRDGVHDVSIGIIPAGTANLLAHGLGIPIDLEAAVVTALQGRPEPIDVGRMNGEHFAVMAGTGFDALMIRDADNGLKDRIGRTAYLWTGAKNLKLSAARMKVEVDGEPWFEGRASCLLVANIGTILGGVRAFPQASCTDGRLDVGVVRAESRTEWLRVLALAAASRADHSSLVETTTATRVRVRLDRTLPWELDGGSRDRVDHFKARVLPRRIAICVPA